MYQPIQLLLIITKNYLVVLVIAPRVMTPAIDPPAIDPPAIASPAIESPAIASPDFTYQKTKQTRTLP